MKIKIKVTKEIYRKSMMCGLNDDPVNTSCAIALAKGPHKSYNNEETIAFINTFDSLKFTPEKRLDLPEFEFEVDFPDELVNQIGIDEVKDILSKSETLELVK